MSLIGKVHLITVKRDGALQLVNFEISDFLHEVGFTTATSVVKRNIADTVNDTYVVKVAYPNGSVPATSTTIANLVTTATNAITSALGAGELA